MFLFIFINKLQRLFYIDDIDNHGRALFGVSDRYTLLLCGRELIDYNRVNAVYTAFVMLFGVYRAEPDIRCKII